MNDKYMDYLRRLSKTKYITVPDDAELKILTFGPSENRFQLDEGTFFEKMGMQEGDMVQFYLNGEPTEVIGPITKFDPFEIEVTYLGYRFPCMSPCVAMAQGGIPWKLHVGARGKGPHVLVAYDESGELRVRFSPEEGFSVIE